MIAPTSPPYAGRPASRPRPSGWWFAAGGGLLVAAVVLGVALFASTLSTFLSTEVRVDATSTQQVEVGTDGDRMLWLEEESGTWCSVVDLATGEAVTSKPLGGELRRSDGSGEWVGALRFEPGSGRLEISCSDPAGTLLVGPAPSVGGFVGGLLLTVLIPLALGASGLAVLVVTGVLWATRPARPRGPVPGPGIR